MTESVTTFGADYSAGRDVTCVSVRRGAEFVKMLFGLKAEFFLLAQEVTHG